MPTIITFKLNTPAVQLIESTTKPGATIKVSAVDTGTAYTKIDYFASQSSSGPYFADNSTSVSFVINYMVEYASGKGNGMGKITGTIDVDAGGNLTVNALDVGGNAVTYTVDKSGIQQTVNLANPITAGKIEVTTGMTRYRFSTIPTTATVTLTDSRDGTIIPIAAMFANGAQYALPILNANGASNDILYSVVENSYETATGKFTVTRTGTGMTNTVTFTADGNEKAYTYNITGNPRVVSIELEKINMEYDITFAVSSADAESEIVVTVDGTVIVPEDGGHYIIPFTTENTPLSYTITADSFHTVSGQFLLKPDGTIEDITTAEEKDKTISYTFSAPESKLFIQLMPSFKLVVTGATTAVIPLGEMLPYCFSDHLNLYGSRVTGGKLEFVNDTGNEYKIVGVEVIGHAELSHNVFRTFNDALENIGINGFDGKFSELKAVVAAANAKYPGENFSDYYDYLLYYYKNIYVSAFGNEYSNITSLDELEPLDMGTIWTGNVLMDDERFDGTQADIDAGLVYEFAGPNYAYVENDDRLVQLAEKLISQYAFYLSFDNTKAGPIPITATEINEQNEGLRFYDYVNETPENDAQVKKMFDYVIDANSTHMLTDVAMSIVGSYAHNGYINNGLAFAFEVNLITEIPVINVPYTVKYYKDTVSAENLIGTEDGTPFPEGHQLTDLDIETDLGPNWLNDKKPTDYKSGEVVGLLPIISQTVEDNVVTVLYERTPAPTASYIVKYYKNAISETNLLSTTAGLSEFSMGHQLTDLEIAADLGLNWLNNKKPTDCKNGVVVGSLPIISITFDDNVVTVLYEETPTPTASYIVKYYKNAISAANLLSTATGLSKFALGHQLTDLEIAADLGPNWLNDKKPTDCKSGVVVGSLPVISITFDDNVVTVLYQETPTPTASYIVKYYKNAISETNLLSTTAGLSRFALGHQLTYSDIAKDLGVNWINAKKPVGYKDGTVVGSLPIISIVINNNVVNVVYLVNQDTPDCCCCCDCCYCCNCCDCCY